LLFDQADVFRHWPTTWKNAGKGMRVGLNVVVLWQCQSRTCAAATCRKCVWNRLFAASSCFLHLDLRSLIASAVMSAQIFTY